MQDALDDRDPGRAGEEHERPGEHAPRCENETGGDHDDALGARADADVAAQADRLGPGAGVRDEERAGDRRHRDRDEDRAVLRREDVRDRGQHEAFADAVGRRVEERAERRRLAARAGERAVEDVEQRADDEDDRGEPVEENLVAALEEHEDRRRAAEQDAARRQGVRRDPGAGEAADRARGERRGRRSCSRA